jgi:SAM-dependent methyltransferase
LQLTPTVSNLLKPELTTQLFENELNVLDVGCGPATWLMELATEYPKSNFYGVDITGWFLCHSVHLRTQLSHAAFYIDTFPQAIYPPNLHLQIANVLEPLPFDVKFDFVQLRHRLLQSSFKEQFELAN